MDPIEHMKINDASFVADFKSLQLSQQRYRTHELKKDRNFQKLYHEFERKEHMKHELAELRQEFVSLKNKEQNCSLCQDELYLII